MLETSVNRGVASENLPDAAEARLVLECVRRALAPDFPADPDTERSAPRADSRDLFSIENLSAMDWPRVALIAAHHGVLPLVYRRLQAAAGVPAAALEQI